MNKTENVVSKNAVEKQDNEESEANSLQTVLNNNQMTGNEEYRTSAERLSVGCDNSEILDVKSEAINVEFDKVDNFGNDHRNIWCTVDQMIKKLIDKEKEQYHFDIHTRHEESTRRRHSSPVLLQRLSSIEFERVNYAGVNSSTLNKRFEMEDGQKTNISFVTRNNAQSVDTNISEVAGNQQYFQRTLTEHKDNYVELNAPDYDTVDFGPKKVRYCLFDEDLEQSKAKTLSRLEYGEEDFKPSYSVHKWASGDQIDSGWSIENIKMFDDNGQKVPTTTYGTIIDGNKEINYVRLAHDTSPVDVFKIINQHWDKAPPILAVSLIGEGDLKTCINKIASEKIFQGMEKVISTPRTCLISDGAYRLNQRLLDSSLPRDQSFMHIGIAHFNSLDIKQCLLDDQLMSVKGLSESTSLNLSHTHLLLVDDDSDTPCQVVDFRSNLESFLFTATNDLTQIVSFAMGGDDAYTLEMLAKTIENQIPLFVVKQGNNQDGADYLATFLEQQQKKSVDELDILVYKRRPKPIKQQLQEKIRKRSSLKYLDTYLVDSAIQKVNSLQQITLIDGNEDVDKLFLDAITENAVSEIDKRTVIMLYVLWSQGDEFWKNNVFARFYPKGDTHTTVVIFMALALNRVDFLKSFRDSLIYKAFSQFTASDLRFLYWYRAFDCPVNERTGVLRHFIKAVSQKEDLKEKGNMDKEDIELSTCMKYFCDITGIELESIASYPTLDIIDEVIRKLKNSMFQKENVSFGKYSHQQIETSLYIWAVLNGMQDMALLLLDFVEQKCSRALVGAALSETISLYHKLPESLREVYNDMSSTFEDVAVNIVERGYKIDAKITKDLITRELDFVKGYTCVDLAISAKQLKFISHPSVHSIFNNFWRGPWKYEFTVLDFALTLLCPYYLTKFDYCDDKQLHELSELFGEHIYLKTEWKLPWPKRQIDKLDVSEELKEISDPKTGETKQYTTRVPEDKNDRCVKEPDRDGDNQSCKTPLCCTNFCDFTYKVYLYFKTPKVKFFWHVISYTIFLCLLSYSVLEAKDASQILVNDWVLLAFIVSMTTHEIQEFVHGSSYSVKQRFKSHLSNIWNKMDFLAIVLFYTGFALKAFPSTTEYGHLLLCFDAYIWTVRSLRVLYFFRVMGPYVLMILIMFQDMMKFIVILFVFTIAHGVCFTAIMKPQARSWNMLRDVVFHPYFNIYGELFFEGATNSTTIFGTEKRNEYANTLGLIMLAIYVLIANVLLLNLLIAIFGNTYSSVKDDANSVWAYQRTKLTIEFSQRSILVPPFSILSHLCSLIRWIASCLCSNQNNNSDQKRTFKKQLEPGRNLEVNVFEAKIMKHFETGVAAV